MIAIEEPEPEMMLTRADAEDFCSGRRVPTLAQVEWLLGHQRDHGLRLTTDEVFTLRDVGSRLSAAAHAKLTNPVDDFLGKVLGVIDTGAGHLERSEVSFLRSIYLQAASAIRECKKHSPERCACWRGARDDLFNLRSRVGERSPPGLAALQIWDRLEELSASRTTTHEAPPQPETPFHDWRSWRYWRDVYPSQVAANDPNRPRKLTELMPA